MGLSHNASRPCTLLMPHGGQHEHVILRYMMRWDEHHVSLRCQVPVTSQCKVYGCNARV